MEEESRFADAREWFLDFLKVERGASQHTIEAYSRDLIQAEKFFEKLGLQAWDQLTESHLVRFRVSLRPPIAPATSQRRLSSLRSLLKFLKKNGQGPMADLPDTGGMRKAKRLPKALGQGELMALLEAPNLSKPSGLRDRALMELIYGAGLRISEAIELPISQLDLDSAAISVTGKREKTRWVPLPAQTVAFLERYLTYARPELASKPIAQLIVSDTGLKMRRSTAYINMQKYARLAGFERPISPHVLRHTYAVHLIKGGADLRAVQELLGHETISTTQVYTQLDLDEVRRRYRQAHPRP